MREVLQMLVFPLAAHGLLPQALFRVLIFSPTKAIGAADAGEAEQTAHGATADDKDDQEVDGVPVSIYEEYL